MSRLALLRNTVVTLCVIGGTAAGGAARAAQPEGRTPIAAAEPGTPSAKAALLPAYGTAAYTADYRRGLDLQLRVSESAVTLASADGASTFRAFGQRSDRAPPQSNQSSFMAAGFVRSGTRSRVEGLALRFRREGLPLLRLWENKSALLSLGLDHRGKPGIWVTQKLR